MELNMQLSRNVRSTHTKGIPPTIPKEGLWIIMRHAQSEKNTVISFFAKKPGPTPCYCGLPQFTFCLAEHTHYTFLLNLRLYTSKYRKIQICDTPKICSNY